MGSNTDRKGQALTDKNDPTQPQDGKTQAGDGTATTVGSGSPPKIHSGDSLYDALEDRDTEAIAAECRGLNLVQALVLYFVDPDTGELTYMLSKAGVEEAGRLAGGVDCPKDALTITHDDHFWHAEQEGISRVSKLRRTGSASQAITSGRYNKRDRFGRRKAINLAQRNAIDALLTTKQRAEMVQHGIDIGSTEQIDPPWKKKDDDQPSRWSGSSTPPAPKQAPTKLPEAKLPSKDETLDYFFGIVNEMITEACGAVSIDDRRDYTRAICIRVTQNRFFSAATMPVPVLVSVNRRLERDRDAVLEFIRSDKWKNHLGFPPREGAAAADADASRAPGAGEDDHPPLPTDSDESPPDEDQPPDTGKDDAGTTPSPSTEEKQDTGNAQEGPPDDGGVDSTSGSRQDDSASPASSSEATDASEDPAALAAAIATAKQTIKATIDAVDIKPIGPDPRARKDAVGQCRTAMTKAVIRAGTGKESLDDLTIPELMKFVEQITRDKPAILQWLASGRYLTSKGPEAMPQVDMLSTAEGTSETEN
jgi:hypothetical protein